MNNALFYVAIATTLTLSACSSKSKFAASTATGVGFSQADANTIEFGDADVFRIGDGQSGIQSACVSELTGYALKGTTYYFQFQVLEDATEINLVIDKVCGVDNAKGTFISLQSDAKAIVVPEIGVPTDASGTRAQSWSPFTASTLNKGIYSVVVRSANINPGASNGDFNDDFIIGKLNLNASKQVKAVQVFAE